MTQGVGGLKAVLDLALAGVEAGLDISKDGKIGVEDAAALLKLIPAVGPAVAAFPQVPAEISDLDAQEAADLVAHVMAKLAVDDVKAKEVIVASLKLLVAGHGLYKAVKA